MATAVQDCKVGTLVGQSTGGFANQTGQINFFELPQTQLRAFVPSRLMIRPNGDIKTQSVIPDVVVRDQLDGIADTVLDSTLALIANKK
jgi:C-terminal processing protease CtpA/Prc